MLSGNVATIIRTDTGATLPFPTVNDTTNKGVRLAENTQVANQDVAFSIMNLTAFKYSSKMILVSVELMQDAGINLPEFLGAALGERIARIVNDETTVGTGTTMPWGIVTRAVASNAPSGTATVFGSTTAIAYANLVAYLHSVDVSYRQNAKFMMHDLTLAKIKALTDTTGRPVWAPSFATSVPDTLFGYPYVINNSMVSTLVNGVKSIVFGDLSKYIIREVRGITILRSDERFIDYHQSAFLAFARYDGDLLNAGTNPVMAFVHTT
jgi:HK97 family phage major capsid protein